LRFGRLFDSRRCGGRVYFTVISALTKELAMKFDNRSPINLNEIPVIASANREGIFYDRIGHDNYCAYLGKNIHLIHSYSSGCEFNGKIDSSNMHLGMFADRSSLIAYLLKQNVDGIFPWWAAELLDDLGYLGEEA
jgi:hypothetical protein